ncbi:MAG: iron-containing alcohol dehydrogenase [Clostridia bacterium]|nr:iron-containing alcohol dehydrogenase [Clostridia bacterium]
MLDFQYYSPTRVVFGRNAVKELGKLLKGRKKVLLHYGGGSVKKNGVFDAVVEQLKAAEIDYVELGGVAPNPKIGLIREGVKICKEQGVDFILAVGGGSVIDSAKAIALGAKIDFDVWRLYETKERIDGALPLGSVLTIAAAGSELSNGTVVTNPEGGLKRDYGADYLRPEFAIMNPEYTFTVSKYQTACGTVDILMHTFERYFTHTPDVDLTDELAEGLCRAVIRAGRKAVENGNDYEARATLMWAGSISHNDLTGLGRRGDWATHQIEHELSGQYDRVSHGAGLAVIFPAWCRYVWREEPERFVRFAEKIWGVDTEGMTQEEAVFAGIECCENYFRSLGMPVRLSEMDIDDTHLHEMAVKGTYFGKRTLGGFKVLDEADIEAIYRIALK